MDSLRQKFNLFQTSFIYALVWGTLWHLPLFFIKDYYQNELWSTNWFYAVNFSLSIIPLSIIMNWLFYRNNRSIIALVLFHFIVNFSQEIFMINNAGKCFETIVLFIVAGIIVTKKKNYFFKNS